MQAAGANEGFWKTPMWRFFNSENFPKTGTGSSSISKKMEAEVLSFCKDLRFIFICYLLSIVREKTGIFHGGRRFLHLKICGPFFGLKKESSSLHWRRTILCFQVTHLKTQIGLKIGPSPIQCFWKIGTRGYEKKKRNDQHL